MAFEPVPYTERPYASSDGRIGDLLRRRSDLAAEALIRSGERQAQMWSNLGQLGSNTVNSIVQDRREAPIRRDAAQARNDEARLRSLTIQDEERKAAEPARLAAQDQAFMRLMAQSPDGMPDPQRVIGIYGPQRGLVVAQGMHAFGELQRGEVRDARDNAGRLALGLKVMSPTAQAALWAPVKAAAIKGGWGNAVPFPDTPDASFLDGLIQWGTGKEVEKKAPFTLKPGEQRFDADGKPMASVSADKKPDTRPIEVQLADAFRNGDTATAAALQRAIRAGRAPVKPTYEWATDPKTGKNIYASPDEIRAGGMQKPVTGAQRAASGVENKAMGFFNRARQADTDLEGLEAEIQNKSLGGQAWMAMAPNFLQSQEGQQYTQAQRAFTEARLRKDSGAAIPEQEFANDRRTYFVQPGDTKETLDQKRRARATILASLGVEAGRALVDFEGDPDAAAALITGYKERAQKAPPAAGGPAEGTRGVVNGQPAVWKTVNGKAGWYAAN